MSKVWPYATIRELVALADANGSATAVLDSLRSAELFRFAIYSFRKATGLGNDISVTIDDKTVILTKRVMPQVTILQEQEQA